ncbi:MAG: GTPase/DUF3482 domain-containing protein [Candidatus Sedimenticola sp. (ex Thyasira tokunagai)]
MVKHPVFAVVGHPNKGKSSVVAALTQNDQVEISPLSGTTRVAQHFTLKLDQRVVFELVDTPGFQRARSCLSWLTQEEVPADRKPQRIKQFVDAFTLSDRFKDEVELLTPIVSGAGIIYVVDGSLPYSPEYETEMEILRWSGSPRLALINPIGGNDYVEQWQSALNQYFSLVRLFDPMNAGFDQHLQLLQTFGQLDSDNQQRFDQAIAELEQYRELKLQQAARIIIENLYRLLTWQMTRLQPEGSIEVLQQLLPDEVVSFNRQLNQMESENRKQLEALFLYHHIESEMTEIRLQQGELMDREQWSMWGLSRGQLVLVSTGTGAAIGLAADAGLGGTTLMTGTVSGGLLGGLSGWLGADWVKERLPPWLRISANKSVIGPVKDPNFAFVILGRALNHARAMLMRSHASRESMSIPEEHFAGMHELDTKSQIRLLKQCRSLQKNGLQCHAAGELQRWVYQALKKS